MLTREQAKAREKAIEEKLTKRIDKSEKSGIMNLKKRLSSDKIEWLPKGENISAENFKILRDYVNSAGFLIQGLKKSDVDINLMKEIIDSSLDVLNAFPELKGTERKHLTIILSETMLNNDFASTNKKHTHIIELNINAFRNAKKLEYEYNKLVDEKWFVQGSSYNSIIKHELGHLYQLIHNISDEQIVEIAMKITNIDNRKSLFSYLKANLSEYSASYKDGSEIISEVFSDFFGSKNPTYFSREFISELLKMR
ncbi:MAG: hypothetical protein ACI4JW_01585 [Oscillospiraceae bacterium]